MSEYKRLRAILTDISEKVNFKPLVALTLGSGLGNYADGSEIDVAAALDYKDIEGFPVSTAPGHRGRFVFAYIKGVPVVIMQGRIHYYEGYPINDVVLPTRLVGLMGAKVLFLTNAAGGINADFKPGDFMLIRDHILNFVPSPLVGPNIDELGVRFPDMSEVYNKKLREIVKSTAKGLGIPLREGVYIQLTGPNYETPAEVHMCRTLGADAVGMSTACEAVAANHMGLKVCGISCISNMSAGMTEQPLSSDEVEQTANSVAPDFKSLVTASIVNIAKDF